MVARVKLKVPRVKLRKHEEVRYEGAVTGRLPDIRTSSAVECKHCKHWYLSPCDDAKVPDCLNYQHILSQKFKGKKRKR